jgi:Pyruvate/2-oxoacid:ferredoxin oxidoreductase gamma subunit
MKGKKTMSDTIKIVFNGRGGQGIVLAGEVIAKAISAYNPKYKVALNSNYGAQARGGLSQVSLVLSTEAILYPLVDDADILVISGVEGLKAGTHVHSSGLIIADEDLDIDQLYPTIKGFHLPLTKTLIGLKLQRGINMLILGVISEVLKEFVSYEMIKDQIGEHFKANDLEQQLKLIDTGVGLINQINKA